MKNMITATQILHKEKEVIREIVLKDTQKLIGHEVDMVISLGATQIKVVAEIKRIKDIIKLD